MHFWTCWHQDGEKDGQDGDQEAQDGRWKAKMGLQIHATNIRLMRAMGAGSLKGLKVLIELMHKRKNLIARRVPCGTVADIYIYIYIYTLSARSVHTETSSAKLRQGRK